MNALTKKPSLMRSCKQVTDLVIAREDRGLALAEQLALNMHMAIGKACPVSERQVLTLRNAMKRWRNCGAGDE